MAGSVGGQTVRRSQNGQILYNKSQKRNTGAISKNTQVKLLQTIMTGWLPLSDSLKAFVVENASKNVYYNKFGDPVYLSPYNYYVSCMTKLNICNSPSTNNLMNNDILPSTDLVVNEVWADQLWITLALETGSNSTYFILSVFVSARNTITPNAKMAKIIYGGVYQNYHRYDAYIKMLSFYPNAAVGQFCTFFIQAVAYNGYSGGTTFLNKVEITNSL